MAILLIENFRFSHKRALGRDGLDCGTSRGRIVEEFANRLFLSDGGAFLITGYRGVGKTTFVQDVLRRLQSLLTEKTQHSTESGPLLLDVYLNIARPLSGVELMHFLLRQLHNRLSDLQLLKQLPKPLLAQLRLAFLRTSAMLALNSSREAETSLSLEKWLSFSSKLTSGTSRDINYLAYDERSAENDLIEIARCLTSGFQPCGWFGRLHKPIKLKLLFVFDELDKIEDSHDGESPLAEILHTLKTLFTTSGIDFIFVAGRALHERWRQDVQRGDSVFESVFSESRYLSAVWDQVDEICDPLLLDQASLSEYELQLYADFKRYLAFTGRGIPRRILRSFYERVRWDGHSASLALTEQDRRQIRFHAELYQLLTQSEHRVLGDQSRDLRPDWLDKQRLGLYYILDWILSRAATSFTLAEVIDAAANELQPGIAPASELAPRVVSGLLQVLRENDYVEAFTDPAETQNVQTQPVEKYRLPERRLIEMGCYREMPETTEKKVTRVLGGRYQLLEQLARGGSGEVHRALDRRTGRMVALKQFHTGFSSADSSLRERLQQEIAVHRQLRHSGIAAILDVEFSGPDAFIVMELVEGVSLEHILATQGTLSPEEAVDITRSLLETLEFVHAQGVVWRDAKPSNILINPDGRVVIVDFGIAQTERSAREGPDTTRIGFVMGTPAYMCPEQWLGERLTPASDLFSLGVILFEMLTGEKPWPVVGKGNWSPPHAPVEESPAFRQIRDDLQAVVKKSLLLSADQRFQSAAEMRAALPGVAREHELKQRVARSRETMLDPAMLEGSETIAMGAVEQLSQADSERSPVAPPPSPPDLVQATSLRTARKVKSTSAPKAAVLIEDPHSITIPRAYPLLTVTDDSGEELYGMFGDRLTLGRSVECDIALDDGLASRFHAAILREDNHYFVEDLNSGNGISVSGERIYQKHPLEKPCTFSIGKTRVEFSPPQTQA